MDFNDIDLLGLPVVIPQFSSTIEGSGKPFNTENPVYRAMLRKFDQPCAPLGARTPQEPSIFAPESNVYASLMRDMLPPGF